VSAPGEIPEELHTDRLLLRRWREADRGPFATLNADPDVTRYVTVDGRPLTEAESSALVDRIEAGWDERGYGLWAVEDRATGTFLGFCGLSHHRALPDEVEIGWRFARPWWGRGLATEAAAAAQAHAFDTLGLTWLVSIHVAENVASRRIMEKLGLRYWKGLDWDGLQLVVFAGGPEQGRSGA